MFFKSLSSDSMNLENIPLEIGQTVFFPKDTAAGKKYKPAKVVTIYAIGVVELEIVTDIKNGKMKRQKFAVKDLRRSEPPKEEAK
jgi:hypothetical protein